MFTGKQRTGKKKKPNTAAASSVSKKDVVFCESIRQQQAVRIEASAATKSHTNNPKLQSSTMTLTLHCLSAYALLLAGSSCCLANSSTTGGLAESFSTSTTASPTNSSAKQLEAQASATQPFSKIAGLYEQDQLVTPIQGQESFERFVQRASGNDSAGGSSSNGLDALPSRNIGQLMFDPKSQTINLVQFYMATCPDCQGFSPYFKRLVSDIGPHWRHLVRVAVVNCNDDLNINLCWQQNPNLIVPLVRWYTLPVLLADHANVDEANREFNYPIELLNVAHRSYIERQRRDLISLRHATLRFITSILDHLSQQHHLPSNAPRLIANSETNVAIVTNQSSLAAAKITLTTGSNSSNKANLNLYNSLPIRWKLMRPLIDGRRQRSTATLSSNLSNNNSDRLLFIEELDRRICDCIQESQLNSLTSEPILIENFILFERNNSFAGKTLVADWSNWTCSPELSLKIGVRKLMMIHYTSDFSLLNELNLFALDESAKVQLPFALKADEASRRAPLLFSLSLISLKQQQQQQTNAHISQPQNQTVLSSSEQLQLRLIGSNYTKITSSSSSSSFNSNSFEGSGGSSGLLSIASAFHHGRPTMRRRRRGTREASAFTLKQTSAAPQQQQGHQEASAMLNPKAGISSGDNHRAEDHSSSGSGSRLERLSQRMSLEQYYTRRRSVDSVHRHPLRYAALMTGGTGQQAWRKRARRSAAPALGAALSHSTITPLNPTNRLLIIENINWAPEELYPGEEKLRYQFNEQVARIVFGPFASELIQVPGFNDGNQGEINITKRIDTNKVVEPKDEDLALVRLTDYYKVLAEIVHKNMLNRAEQDGFQLLASSCFLRTLTKNFPFQGGLIQRKSVARNYLELMQREFLERLQKRIGSINGNLSVAAITSCSSANKLNQSRETRERLSKLRVPSKDLELVQEEIRKKHDVGLPADAHFKWSYCAGSSEYLRGHTCSLWILFHTLTVQEYLSQMNETDVSGTTRRLFRQHQQPASYANVNLLAQTTTTSGDLKYKYTLRPNKRCNAANPEERLLSLSPAELYLDAPNYALATIINFVRFFMSCTNCAAHFSCMVENSELEFAHPNPGDHLLWLWEAHNRVNLRTKRTHSEDALHPKHVFPDYEACPDCYIERPASKDIESLDSLKFNRRELTHFIVARYRRSAILNNKIRIEDLFRKPVPMFSTVTLPIVTNSTTNLTEASRLTRRLDM